MNKVNKDGYNESTKFGPSENNPPMSMFDKKYILISSIDGIIIDTTESDDNPNNIIQITSIPE